MDPTDRDAADRPARRSSVRLGPTKTSASANDGPFLAWSPDGVHRLLGLGREPVPDLVARLRRQGRADRRPGDSRAAPGLVAGRVADRLQRRRLRPDRGLYVMRADGSGTRAHLDGFRATPARSRHLVTRRSPAHVPGRRRGAATAVDGRRRWGERAPGRRGAFVGSAILVAGRQTARVAPRIGRLTSRLAELDVADADGTNIGDSPTDGVLDESIRL